jgi:biopolymer transport protein ExbD
LFILIVVVLFLHTWLTLRLTLKWKGLKWISISFISVTLLAFSLSRINLIDYEKINQKILQKNINFKYKLELPESESYERIEKPSLLEEIYLVRPPGQSESSKPVIITDNETTDLNQLNSRINYWQSKRDDWENLLTIYYLHIDKSIKMKFVNELKTELTNSGVRNIAYTIVPSHREFDKRFYTRLGLTMRLNNKSLNSYKNTQLNKHSRQIDYVINIKQTKSGFLINDTVFGPRMLKNEIKKFIYQKTNYLIHFHVNDTTSFANYIIVLSAAKQAVIELRNEYSKTQYTKDYADLNEDELIVVNKRFPLFWYESTNENNPK